LKDSELAEHKKDTGQQGNPTKEELSKEVDEKELFPTGARPRENALDVNVREVFDKKNQLDKGRHLYYWQSEGWHNNLGSNLESKKNQETKPY